MGSALWKAGEGSSGLPYWASPGWDLGKRPLCIPLIQGRALHRMPTRQVGPALPQATLSHPCPSPEDPGEHLLQAAHRLNNRANLDQQVLLKCANHLLFLSCF